MIVLPATEDSIERLRRTAESGELTYEEVGATLRGAMPAGYDHVTVSGVVGRGADAFARARTGLSQWQTHTMRGVRVRPRGAPVVVGTTVVTALGVRAVAVAAPCRVVVVVDDPQRFGFAYGTLPGHPETGEESFVATVDPDGTVRLHVRAFSKPAGRLRRATGPATHMASLVMAHAYVRSLRHFVEANSATA